MLKKRLPFLVLVCVSGGMVSFTSVASQNKIRFENQLGQDVTFEPTYKFSFLSNPALAFGKGVHPCFKPIVVNASSSVQYPALILTETLKGGEGGKEEKKIEHPFLKSKGKPTYGIQVTDTSGESWGIYPVSMKNGFVEEHGPKENEEPANISYKVTLTNPINNISTVDCEPFNLKGNRRLTVKIIDTNKVVCKAFANY